MKDFIDTLPNRVYTETATREFIISKEFDRVWKELGLDDDDLNELELFLCKNPNVGVLMQGTGGIRKLRWSLESRGKSGGARVIYLDVVFSEHLYLITAYPKNQKANLSKEERNQMKALVAAIKQAEKEARNGGKQSV